VSTAFTVGRVSAFGGPDILRANGAVISKVCLSFEKASNQVRLSPDGNSQVAQPHTMAN
jgi:hypothetical protein